MTKRAAFTEAAIRRAIKSAKKEGLRIVGIKPDGTILVDATGAGIAPQQGSSQTDLPPQDSEAWGEVEA